MKKIGDGIAQLVWLAAAITVMVLASSVELLDGEGRNASDQQANKASSGRANTNTGTIGLGDMLQLAPSLGYGDAPGKVEPR